MAKVERTVTAALTIIELCRELHMTEEQLLVHLAVEHNDRWLSARGQRRVLAISDAYRRRNVFVVEVETR